MATSTPSGTVIVAPNPGDFGSGAVPIGTVLSYSGPTPPAGWLFARGQAVSRAQYASLFAVIGTIYGGGDGSTTFNVPNLEGRVLRGSGASTWQIATTGGNDNVMLQTNNMAPHSHAIWQGGNTALTSGTGTTVGQANTDSGWADNGTIYGPGTFPGTGTRSQVVSNTGAGQQPVSVINSYIAMPYIIRAQ